METFNTQSPAGGYMTGGTKTILSLVVLLAVAGGLYYLLSGSSTNTGPMTEVQYTEENVKVSQVDLSSSGSKTPAGFPASIPIEQAGITDSYKATYEDYGMTQHTVNYTSSKTRDALWKQYTDYFSANGYILDTNSSRKETGVMRGVKGKTEINVIMVVSEGKSYITVNYIVRQ